MTQRPSSGTSTPPSLQVVPPQLTSQGGSAHSTRATPSRASVHGKTSPPSKRRISVASSAASGASLASLLVRIHQPASSSLSLEGKLKIRATLDCGSDVLYCKFSPDGTLVGAALRSGQVKFFNQVGALSYTLQLPKDDCSSSSDADNSSNSSNQTFPAPATSVSWLPGGQTEAVLTTYSDGRVVSWRGRSVGVVADDGAAGVDVRAAAMVGGLDNQVVTFTRGQVTLRDVNTLQSVVNMDQGVGGQLVGRGSVWAVAGRGRDLVGGMGGGGLTWWDGRTGGIVRSVGGAGVHVRGPALAWHPNVNKVVSGSWGGGGADSVKVWEATTGRMTHVLHSDAVNTSVYSVAWAGKDVVAVGGADPNLLRLTTLDNTTVGVLRGVRHTVWMVDAVLGRGHQGTRLALAAGSSLYLLDVLK